MARGGVTVMTDSVIYCRDLNEGEQAAADHHARCQLYTLNQERRIKMSLLW